MRPSAQVGANASPELAAGLAKKTADEFAGIALDHRRGETHAGRGGRANTSRNSARHLVVAFSRRGAL